MWRVSRRWVPWRRRRSLPAWEDRQEVVIDRDAGVGESPVLIALNALSLVVGILLALPALVAVLAFAAEAVLVIALVPFAALARVVMGRHWTVEVTTDLTPVWETEVGRWGQTRQALSAIASGLEQGVYPWEEQPGRALIDLNLARRGPGGAHRRGSAPAPPPAADRDRERHVIPAPPRAPRRPGAPGRPRAPGSVAPGR